MPKRRSRKAWTRELDALCSEVVRRAGVCERCGKRPEKRYLHHHHIIGRANRRLRWEPRNGVALCFHHHFQWAEAHPLEFADWIRAHRPDDAAFVQATAHEIANWSDDDLKRIRDDLKRQLDDTA